MFLRNLKIQIREFFTSSVMLMGIAALLFAHHLFGRETLTKEEFIDTIQNRITELKWGGCAEFLPFYEEGVDDLAAEPENRRISVYQELNRKLANLSDSNVLIWHDYKRDIEHSLGELESACLGY